MIARTVEGLGDGFAVAKLRLFKSKVDGFSLRVERCEQYSRRTEVDLTAFEARFEAEAAPVDGLAARIQKPTLPDLGDREDPRVETVVDAIRLADVDGAP